MYIFFFNVESAFCWILFSIPKEIYQENIFPGFDRINMWSQLSAGTLSLEMIILEENCRSPNTCLVDNKAAWLDWQRFFSAARQHVVSIDSWDASIRAGAYH